MPLNNIISEDCSGASIKVQDYIIERCKTDEYLLNKINSSEKTIKQCWDYIIDCAKQELEGKNGAIEDEKVYEWAVHFFIEDDVQVKVVKHVETKPKVEMKPKKEESKQTEQMSLFDFIDEQH